MTFEPLCFPTYCERYWHRPCEIHSRSSRFWLHVKLHLYNCILFIFSIIQHNISFHFYQLIYRISDVILLQHSVFILIYFVYNVNYITHYRRRSRPPRRKLENRSHSFHLYTKSSETRDYTIDKLQHDRFNFKRYILKAPKFLLIQIVYFHVNVIGILNVETRLCRLYIGDMPTLGRGIFGRGKLGLWHLDAKVIGHMIIWVYLKLLYYRYFNIYGWFIVL